MLGEEPSVKLRQYRWFFIFSFRKYLLAGTSVLEFWAIMICTHRKAELVQKPHFLG